MQICRPEKPVVGGGRGVGPRVMAAIKKAANPFAMRVRVAAAETIMNAPSTQGEMGAASSVTLMVLSRMSRLRQWVQPVRPDPVLHPRDSVPRT